jgi:polar amino acid transport system substrate-binding protein
VNGSVYNQNVGRKVNGTREQFYASLADCIAAVEAGKADAAVQLSYCLERAVNRRGGTVAMRPEDVDPVDEAFFFPHGDPLIAKFNEVIKKYEADGTIASLTEKWVSADDSGKTLPTQDWDAPNGTLKFATSGVLDPYSYVGDGGEALGYDVDLALHIAKDLGYHLEISTIPMDSIFAAVQTGKVDFGGTLTNTPERAEMVDFTREAIPSYVAVVVKSKQSEQGGAGFFEGISKAFHKTFIEEDRWQLILSGLGVTVLISVCSGVLGTLLGYGVVLARRNGKRWASKLVDGYQALMGGVPIAVVLMVLYYVVFGSLNIPGTIVSIIAFTLAFGSTSGTTMWTAISGIDSIQEEAGLALGYTRHQAFHKIVFPQAAQQFIPQLAAQFVSLVKETSVVGFIAVQDLTRAGDLIRARTMDAFFPLIATAVIYFIVCRLLAKLLSLLAAKIDVNNRPREIEGVQA